jgi:hypothetical protein
MTENTYKPELGQCMFGNEWGDKNADWATEGLLRISRVAHDALGADPDEVIGLAGESCAYGINFENETFEIYSFWWGDDDSPKAYRPNFRHKASGIEIRWYKHINRGMSSNVEKPDNWEEIVRECIESTKKGDQE